MRVSERVPLLASKRTSCLHSSRHLGLVRCTRRLHLITAPFTLSPASCISQLNGHVQAGQQWTRELATASSSSSIDGSVISSTRVLSPGNNVATITISNKAKLNIVNTSILAQLTETAKQLTEDASLRAVVLTGGETAPGKPPSFIGGADIKEMHQLSSAEEARSFITRIHLACKALRDLPVPIIARVHGFSLGAGLEIMAACDLCIATTASVFGMPEVKVGIPSVIEAAFLPGLIGAGRTRRLLYLAEIISAAEAERWGLVEKLVDDEPTLDEAIDDWVVKIAGMGPAAVRSQKRLMQKWENCTIDEGIEAGVESFAEAFMDGGKEPKEFMGRFVNRKK